MKRVEREIYGFGPRLSTRQDRAAVVACWFVIACMLVALALLLGVLGAQLWA